MGHDRTTIEWDKSAWSQASPDAWVSIPVNAGHQAGALSLRVRIDGEEDRAKEKTQLGKIDINTATEKELTTVPGIGHVMAARIMWPPRSRPKRGSSKG